MHTILLQCLFVNIYTHIKVKPDMCKLWTETDCLSCLHRIDTETCRGFNHEPTGSLAGTRLLRNSKSHSLYHDISLSMSRV
jgi:hypothetical protein